MTIDPAPRTGALLIHGLGGTQYDLGPMHKVLRRAGVETHAVTLPGHGGTPADLLSVRAEQWMATVAEAYDALVDQYETFHVIGMCMGALLAVALCERRQHRKGRLVALSWGFPVGGLLGHCCPGAPSGWGLGDYYYY